MSTAAMLAQEQQALLCALTGEHDDSGLWPRLQFAGGQAAIVRRGLQAYRANGLALAERALGAAYPVLAQLIGDESFAPLARYFWRHHPPCRGDIAQWGGGLASFLEASPQLADETYLGDVARIEWALHQAATAADVQPDPHSFALLSTVDPGEVTLTLGAGVFLLASLHPAASIVNAHLRGEPSLADAAALLRDGVAEHALVWRQGFKPRVRAITAAEHAFLAALQSANSLEDALGRALECANRGTAEPAVAFSFNQWLGRAAQDGLVTGARLLNATAFEAAPAAEPNASNLHDHPEKPS
ncbi:putative DNA-binding domain-containing protein [Polaromonas sp. CT11-55]|uniref:HvfC/BufC family peptide modification chaperone n=1 Tax=Polaromonas sp. CT11-55 TaxID=3243045 RepID=UPI0039A52CBE